MDRIVVNRSATLAQTFYSDGVAVTPSGTPTVTVTRSDGSVVTTGAVAGTGTGPYTVTIPASSNTLLDTLRAAWTATIGGQANTYVETVEVAGGYHFALADLRTFDASTGDNALADTVKYPTASLLAARTMAEQALEDACGTAFVPRFRRRTLDGTGTTLLYLGDANITGVRSASVAGTAYSAGDLAALVPGSDGTIYSANRWTAGTRNVVVGYEYGMAYSPPLVSRASMLLARWFLIKGPWDDRATSMSTEFGSFALVTPGVRGAMFSIPEVNATVDMYRVPVLG